MNPGMMGDASFASSVRVIDKAGNVDMPAEISMNQPLVYGGFTFYQSGHDETADGRQVSILAVARDPGRFLKYLGSLMICLGVFAMFYKKAFSFLLSPLARRRGSAGFWCERQDRAVGPGRAGGRRRVDGCRRGRSPASIGGSGDRLPVQDGGRQKPLDTLAWETFRTISNKSSFTDPETQQKLDPTALYLSCCLRAGNGIARRVLTACRAARVARCSRPPHKPDAWDREPLLLVDSLALRAALGLPADQKYISYFDLGRAKSSRQAVRRRRFSSGPENCRAFRRRSSTSSIATAWSWPSDIGPTRTSAADGNSTSCRSRGARRSSGPRR